MKAYTLTTENNGGRFDGTLKDYPSVFPEPELFYGETPNETNTPPAWWKPYDGKLLKNNPHAVWCCKISKQKLFMQHYEKYPDEDLLLLEDDVIFKKNFDEVYNSFMQNVPADWKMLFFGGVHSVWWLYMPFEVAPGVLRCPLVVANECMVIKSDFVPTVIASLSEENWSVQNQSDVKIASLMRRNPTYAPVNFIAGQRGDYSVIQNGPRVQGFRNNFAYVNLEGKIVNTRMRQTLLDRGLD